MIMADGNNTLSIYMFYIIRLRPNINKKSHDNSASGLVVGAGDHGGVKEKAEIWNKSNIN